VILSNGDVVDEWNVEVTDMEGGQCAVEKNKSESAAETISACGKKNSE